MTFIKDILTVEEEAKLLIEKAHADAKTNIANAYTSRKEVVASAQQAALKKNEAALAEQKNALADIYKDTYKKGSKAVQKIAEKAGANHKKTLTTVLESILS